MSKLLTATLSILLACYAPATFGYVGPGLGVGALAAIFGVFAGIVMLLIGSVWYPLKRLFGRLRSKD